jgi:hypothetical protein
MQIDRFRQVSSPLSNRWVQASALRAAGLAASAVLVRYLTSRAESQHRQLGELIEIDNTRINYVDRGSGPVACRWRQRPDLGTRASKPTAL